MALSAIWYPLVGDFGYGTPTGNRLSLQTLRKAGAGCTLEGLMSPTERCVICQEKVSALLCKRCEPVFGIVERIISSVSKEARLEAFKSALQALVEVAHKYKEKGPAVENVACMILKDGMDAILALTEKGQEGT